MRRGTTCVSGAVMALGALVGACGLPGPTATHRAGPGSKAGVTTTTSIPLPPLAWAPCQRAQGPAGLQCASLEVPLDYTEPDGPKLAIAVARHPAEDPAGRLGSLVINPGGPGGSGIDDLPAELRVLTGGLLAHFDIVSFDPRGVDRSAPVSCAGDGGAPSAGPLPDPAPPTAVAQQAVVANDREYAGQCAKATGVELAFVGTVDAARDLDRLRAALGDGGLTYIGHSYGTLLGLTYADLFPTRVRAMVLDGVIDPALSSVQMVTDQAVGFEGMLQRFFSWCASSTSCPWRPSGDATQALLALVERSRRSPLPAGGAQSVGPGELYTAVLSALYSSGSWARLGQALAAADAGDATALYSMTQGYQSENGPNAVDAENAISCLDHPTDRDPSDYPKLAGQAARVAPFFGPMLVWGLLQCALWPVPPTRVPHAVSAAGSPPILVVGTSGDPATPHQWAVSVAHELARGVLVTWEGQNHVAYYYSPCVRAIDQAYLVAGTVPPDATVCND